MKHLAAFAIWLSIGLSAAHTAGGVSVDEVLPGCKAILAAGEGRSNPAVNRDALLAMRTGRCLGLIEGTISAAYSLGICLPTGPASPEGPTINQIIRVVVNFIEEHPAKMHEGFVPLAVPGTVGRLALQTRGKPSRAAAMTDRRRGGRRS
jgi:hypothetical protein